MPKFVCMDCGCREVNGVGTAVAEIKIDEDGNIEKNKLDWEHFEGMICNECGSENVLQIGTGKKYND